MTVEQRIDEPSNQFPVGMRVLAVDDDPTCLMLLETLLRKCHYHVTTTNQAVKALKLLRENKNKFDLVISDVHMPDMDGFKLLELVGLEMDLPVIMLSANGDTKLVMKGITHGACDYLLKPVRIEELRNIWQHVIRRKKFDSRDHNNSDKPQPENGVGQGLKGVGDSDQNGLLNRKRKDQDEDEGDENDENGNHSDDPSTQKKPRVVWSVELHRKFVAAVNQLGIDKAVPKRILELMNVEKLTRENVASHLQKYRLYLKRISCVASQQANMAAALGSADLSYLRVGSLNGIGNVHAMMGSSAQLQNAVFRSLPSGMFGRLNSPAGLSMRGFSSSAAPQLCHAQDSSNIITDECHPIIVQGNQSGNVLQGMPMPLEIDQLQRNKGVSHVAEISNITNDSTVFPVSGGFSDIKANVGSSSNSILDVPNNPLMIQGHHREIQRSRAFGDQSSVTVAFSNSEFPSHLVDFGRCNDNWPSAVHSIGVQSNCFRLNDCFKQATLSDLTDSASSFSMPSGNNPHDVNSITSVPNHFLDSRTNFQCQDVSINSLARKNMNDAQEQVWDGHTQDASHHSNPMCSSTSSLVPPRGLVGPIGQNLDPNNTICHGNSFNMVGQANFVDPQQVHLNEVEQSAVEQRKVNCSSAYNNVGSLEDLASVMMKRV